MSIPFRLVKTSLQEKTTFPDDQERSTGVKILSKTKSERKNLKETNSEKNRTKQSEKILEKI